MNLLRRLINEILELSPRDPRVRRLIEKWSAYVNRVNMAKLKKRIRSDVRRQLR